MWLAFLSSNTTRVHYAVYIFSKVPTLGCVRRVVLAHSQMEHYFFSYLLTCEVYLIKVLEIMAQILQYITFLSLKAIKVSSDFILNYLKKVVGGATTQKYQKQMLKP